MITQLISGGRFIRSQPAIRSTKPGAIWKVAGLFVADIDDDEAHSFPMFTWELKDGSFRTYVYARLPDDSDTVNLALQLSGFQLDKMPRPGKVYNVRFRGREHNVYEG